LPRDALQARPGYAVSVCLCLTAISRYYSTSNN